MCWGPAGRSAHVGQEEVEEGEKEEVQPRKVFSENFPVLSFPAQRRRGGAARRNAKAPRAAAGEKGHERKNPAAEAARLCYQSREASTLLASYAKATQAFIAEHGFVPRTSEDIGQYVSVTGCAGPDPVLCKTSSYGSVNYIINARRVWYSHSGIFEIWMLSYPNNRVIYTATPSQWSPGNLGVSACVSMNGSSKLLEGKTERAPSITC